MGTSAFILHQKYRSYVVLSRIFIARASDLLTVKRMRRIATRDNTIQLGIRLSSRFQKSKVFTKLFILVRNFALINE